MHTAAFVGRGWKAGIFVGAVIAGAALAAPAIAQEGETPEVARIEEDWTLDIGAPDPNTDAPQIINVLSYCGCTTGAHAVFELNHRTMPTYYAGGMQLQTWVTESLYSACIYPRFEKLNTADEAIRYTLSMSATSGTLKFEVLNGTSTTWGAFGGQGYLKTTMNVPNAHLQHYDPALSVKNSRVAFAGHRVRKFALKEVRYYAADNSLISTDATERIVHIHEAESGG